MGAHRVYLPLAEFEGEVVPGARLRVLGEEARHAVRVKRLEPGERVELLDGAGAIAIAAFEGAAKLGKREGWAIELAIESCERVAPVSPRVELFGAVAKGARVEEMIDGLSQVGAAAWRPLAAEWGGVAKPKKPDRLERIAGEAAKQCGRAWALEIGDEVALPEALRPDADRIVVADASGGAFEPGPCAAVRVLIGPEGGWSDRERAAIDQAAGSGGVEVCSFGPHTMRVEVATVVAAAIVLDRQRGRVRAVE